AQLTTRVNDQRLSTNSTARCQKIDPDRTRHRGPFIRDAGSICLLFAIWHLWTVIDRPLLPSLLPPLVMIIAWRCGTNCILPHLIPGSHRHRARCRTPTTTNSHPKGG